jgi:hypothetical protein
MELSVCAKLTVEKLGAGADYIDVHTLYRRGMLERPQRII